MPTCWDLMNSNILQSNDEPRRADGTLAVTLTALTHRIVAPRVQCVVWAKQFYMYMFEPRSFTQETIKTKRGVKSQHWHNTSSRVLVPLVNATQWPSPQVRSTTLTVSSSSMSLGLSAVDEHEPSPRHGPQPDAYTWNTEVNVIVALNLQIEHHCLCCKTKHVRKKYDLNITNYMYINPHHLFMGPMDPARFWKLLFSK